MVIVTIIIIVAVVIIMKNSANSKKMEALIREAELRSIEREAEYNARKKDESVVEIVSTVVNTPTEDVEIVGDQSLMLDEDPSDEYDEMADNSGISKITPPQINEKWVESRQVEPVKDLSVGIAIANDVSKKENLQTGKTSSKYPIEKGTGVRAECADGKCGDPSKYPQPKPLGSVRRMDGTYSNPIELARNAARNAAQKRDSDIKRVLDEKVQLQAKSAMMQRRKYADTSNIQQYDVKPSKAPPANLLRPMGPSFGSMRPAVMPPDHAMKIRQAAMEAAAKAEEEEKMKTVMKVRQAAMEAAAKAEEEEKMKAIMEAQRVAMEAAAKAEEEEKMKADMEAQRVAMEAAAMKVEGYEIMKPLGSMVY